MFKPKLITCLKEYSLNQLKGDFLAGTIVGIVALPLAIAFAIASGVSPDQGLVTAIVAGLIISIFGGSRVQIGGPTGAFVVIVYGIVSKYGMDGLLVATFMGGIILIIMGFSGLGAVIKFIPYPVTIGFTSGIAVIIFSSQIKDALGLAIASLPSEFFGKWDLYFKNIATSNIYAVLLTLITVFIIIFWGKWNKRIPGSVVALIFTTVIAGVCKWPVETIHSRFGHIPNHLPGPHMPHVDWPTVQNLIGPAFSIAILAGIESLLSAVVADGMIGGRHRPNTELIAQGMANIASPIFGGIPATGAIARTATNVRNGAKTPVAGIIHALTLLGLMLAFGHLAEKIPMATLAGILLVVSFGMAEWHSIKIIFRSPRGDIFVFVVTFILTVVFDLTLAIEVGMVLAAFLLMHRLALASNVSLITDQLKDKEDPLDPGSIQSREVPDGVLVYEISGSFFFGIASTFIDTVSRIEKKPKVRIIRMRNVLNVDASALYAIKQIYQLSKKHNIALILSGVHAQPLFAMERAGIIDLVGEENTCADIDEALKRAKEIIRLNDNRLT